MNKGSESTIGIGCIQMHPRVGMKAENVARSVALIEENLFTWEPTPDFLAANPRLIVCHRECDGRCMNLRGLVVPVG